MRKEKKAVILKSALAGSIILSIGLGVGFTWDNSVPKVMVITDAGSVADKSFNNQAWDAAQDIEKRTDGEASAGWIKPMSTSDDMLLDAYNSTYDNGTQINILTGFKHEPAFQKYKGSYSAPYTPATGNLVVQEDGTTQIVDTTGKSENKAIFIDDGELGFGRYYNLTNAPITSDGITLDPYSKSGASMIPNTLENQEFIYKHEGDVQSNHPNTYSQKFETQEASFETAIMAWIYLDHLASIGTIDTTAKIAGAFTGMHIETTYDLLSGFHYGLEYMNNIFINDTFDDNTNILMQKGTTKEIEKHGDVEPLSNEYVRLVSPNNTIKNAGDQNKASEVWGQWGSGTFDPNGGKEQSDILNGKGAYVVMPVAGPQMFDTLYTFSGDHDKKIIGVDVDARNAVAPSQQDQVLTSVQKEIKGATYNFLEIWAYEEKMIESVEHSSLTYPATLTNNMGETVTEGDTITNLEDAKIFGSIQNKDNQGVAASFPNEDDDFADTGMNAAFDTFKKDEDNFKAMNNFLAVAGPINSTTTDVVSSSVTQVQWDAMDIEGFVSYISLNLSVIPGITDNDKGEGIQYGADFIPAASTPFVGV